MLLSKFIRFNSIHGRELHRCLTSKSKYDLFRRNNNNNEEEKKPTFLMFVVDNVSSIAMANFVFLP